MKRLSIVRQSQKDILKKFFNDYLKELSSMDYDIKFDKNGEPIYKWFDCYFSDYGRYAFFLKVDDKIAGLAMVRLLKQDRYEMSEFYVLPEYRCDGNALWFANAIFDLFDGDFDLSAKLNSVRAIKFWSKVAKQMNCEKYTDKDGWREWVITKPANKNNKESDKNNKQENADINLKINQNNEKIKEKSLKICKNDTKLSKNCDNCKNIINNKSPKTHELNLKAIYFDLIKSGEKTLEGRLNSPKIQEFKIGDYITFYKEPEKKQTLKAVILDKYLFNNFDDMANSLNKADLGFANVSKEEMVKVYRNIYDKERETRHGVCILKIKVVNV